ncbi:uroporphyrinogen-III C-methyltransferase [bacterium]|nr:uroporphyrinogen-III C-methyltransferase [bacterium]MBU1615321.1 uroporphyrinogen-III C-methyltransferase [bacterium]
MKGKVYLVGAGPGNPKLLTIKALECLKKADIVLYDCLVSEEILNSLDTQAELLCVGKRATKHKFGQEEINRLLLKAAKEKENVVRLKGGDPFVFGRGGEEAEFLMENGVQVEIVPAVTSSLAAPAYAGIALTHRDYSSELTIVTGRGKEGALVDFSRIARSKTLVILMGLLEIERITGELIKFGRSKNEPVAVIRWGSRSCQQTVVGTLSDISAKVKDLGPPAIIVVGEVVRLREKLNWFESRPLFGKKIVVTRARSQASELKEQLEDYGAQVIEFPTIRIAPLPSYEKLNEAIKRIRDYDWIIFTSQNGVDYFFRQLFKEKKDSRELRGIKIAAIGPKTAERLREFGLVADFQPEEYVAEAIVSGLKKEGVAGKKILIPRALVAREDLVLDLRKSGAEVDLVPCYQTLKEEAGKEEIEKLLENKEIDLITFTSSSTVSNFCSSFDHALLKEVRAAVIGPITKKTALKAGLKVEIVAKEYTIPGLVEAIVSAPATAEAL